MKGYKNFIISLLLIVTILSTMTVSVFADSSGEKAKVVAEEALKGYKERLEPTKFNFVNKEELGNATLGDYISVFTFDFTKLANGTADLRSAMYDSDLIQFIVMSKDRAVNRLTLKKNGETYSRYGFGGNGEKLTNGIGQFTENDKKEVKIVRLGSAEFLYAEKDNKEYLAYIGSMSLGDIEPNKKYNADEILPMLQQIAKESINNSDALGGLATTNKNEVARIIYTLAIAAITIIAVFLWFKRENKKSLA